MIELLDSVKDEFVAHATRDFPREACGLVAIVKGKQQYYECKNIAENDNDFILDPRDYIRVSDFVSSYAGDLVAVIHSHPNTDPRPSMADLVGCEQSGLAWHIYSCKNQEWKSFQPSGYKAPLIGRPYKQGVFDCYSAARDWYAQNGIFIPDFERHKDWVLRGDNLFMKHFKEAGFEQVPEEDLKVGDTILFNIQNEVTNHCAIYIGNDMIFHQTVNRLSSREIYGGWLKKNTRMVIRYKR